MFGVLILICILCTPASGISDRRVMDQLNSIGKTVYYINEDISRLFQDVEKINKTLWSKRIDNSEWVGNDENDKGERAKALEMLEENSSIFSQIASLIEAFESEKRLNRQLQNEIQILNDHKEATEFHIADLVKIQESDRKLTKECLSRLQLLEDKTSEMNLKNEKLEKRLREQEIENSDIAKAIESEKHFDSQVLSRLKTLEENTSEVQFGLETLKDTLSEMHEEVFKNITSSMDHDSCVVKHNTSDTPKANTTDNSGGFIDKQVREITTTPNQINSCKGLQKSGIYNIFFHSLESTLSTYCDSDTDGGGWILTMRRMDGTVSFNRTWNDYKNGFGNVDGEYWIGNDVLHGLTNSEPMELRIDMEDVYGKKAFAKYGHFQVGSESDKYLLTVLNYSGTAGDSLYLGSWSGGKHNGMKFSTLDSDNDRTSSNCARDYSGGWWFNRCFSSHLTGVYGILANRVIWSISNGFNKALKYVEMKVR